MITTIKDVCQTCANTPFYQRFASAKTNTSRLQGLKEELIQAQLRFIVSAQDRGPNDYHLNEYHSRTRQSIWEALSQVCTATWNTVRLAILSQLPGP
jgi:hypothetical protein